MFYYCKLWWVAVTLCRVALWKHPCCYKKATPVPTQERKTAQQRSRPVGCVGLAVHALQGEEVYFLHVPARKLKMFALFQNLEHSPSLDAKELKLNWIGLLEPYWENIVGHINTDNLWSLLLSHIQDNALSETNSSGAHTAVRKAIMAHLYGEKGNATCDALMSYSNYSDQLIFYINTQHSRAVVLLNRSDVNKNLWWYAVWQRLTAYHNNVSQQDLVNKAAEILISFLIHSCCFYGSVLQINQSGHQVQVPTKINDWNNVLCIGRSVGFCREHT